MYNKATAICETKINYDHISTLTYTYGLLYNLEKYIISTNK